MKMKELLVLVICIAVCRVMSRSFSVDMPGGTFLKDGKPFRYVSGSMHYFRIPREYWKDRLYKLRMAGFNAVQTYIEWRSHEPFQGEYHFEDNLDLVHYIQLAQELDLLVILRPGPYIDSERELGGFPFWLLQEDKDMKLRTSDPSFIKFVDRWFSVLLPKLKPLLYVNGGPIISVQIENEYGAYPELCDKHYLRHLKKLYTTYLDKNIVLFTLDAPNFDDFKCGTIDGVLATVDFGAGSNVTENFKTQRAWNGGGPYVNSEYYSGWVDHWGYPHHHVDTEKFLKTMKQMLDLNGNLNVYVFHGGTSYGFNAGPNYNGKTFMPVVTSYDYDAPLSEAGDLTWKYHQTKKLVSKYLPLPAGREPESTKKYNYKLVLLKYIGSIFDHLYELLNGPVIKSEKPLSFEALGQAQGFVIYETTIAKQLSNPAILRVPFIRDRGYVFVDQMFVGVLGRQEEAFNLPISIKRGQTLQIMVENQGRNCYGDLKDFKGISSNVTLNLFRLTSWTMYRLPLNSTSSLKITQAECRCRGPAFYMGTFVLPNTPDMPLDTYILPYGWTRGLIELNGFNLGRYWPDIGPQVTLYTPKYLLKPYPEINTVLLLELDKSNCKTTSYLKFSDEPFINSTTPF